MKDYVIQSNTEVAVCANALLQQRKEAHAELMKMLRSIKETQEEIKALLTPVTPAESIGGIAAEVQTLREPKQLRSRRA